MKKKLIVSALIIMTLLCSFSSIFAMKNYENVDFVTGIVTATALNVRTGPGTGYRVIGTVYKNEYIRVFAKIGDWYVIQTPSDQIGAVSTKYVRKITANAGTTTTTPSTNTSTANNTSASSDEIELLRLINAERAKYGLSELKFSEDLLKAARDKAQDMVNKNYFSHTSPTYGSPFDMMKAYGITYRTAGENIAGNSTLQGAVTAWMNSEGHRANILSNAYNYTGIGIVNSPRYGKILVQMFIGK
ncbi:MAG: SH3 domain-containing protein [Clostridia bacterium]|nr:SH3 domain-containing protein [Clostridia bacterium]